MRKVMMALGSAWLLSAPGLGAESETHDAGVESAEAQTHDAGVENPKVQYDLKLARANAENAVLAVKSGFSSKRAEYSEAARLYTAARDSFNAYTDTLLDNFELDKEVPRDDAERMAKDAMRNVKDFEDYIKALPIRHKGWASALPAMLSSLVDSGLKLYETFHNKHAEKRKKLVDSLRPKIQWRSWEEIKS